MELLARYDPSEASTSENPNPSAVTGHGPPVTVGNGEDLTAQSDG